MATRDSSQLSDIFPWAIISAPGSIFPQSIQAPHDGLGSAKPVDFGGALPWGCERQEPATHDQA